jgi:hypothetical protein
MNGVKCKIAYQLSRLKFTTCMMQANFITDMAGTVVDHASDHTGS